jgi:topoisomerase IA-like protein
MSDLKYVRITEKAIAKQNLNFVYDPAQSNEDDRKLWKGQVKKVDVSTETMRSLIREEVVEKLSDAEAKELLSKKEKKEASKKTAEKDGDKTNDDADPPTV